MAHAALVSLGHVIEQILPHAQLYFLLCGENQMSSLHQHVVFLQEFLENFPEAGRQIIHDLESRIRDVAYQLEDIIESHISNPIDSDNTAKERGKRSEFRSCTEEVESIVAAAKKMKNDSKNQDLLRPYSSALVTASRRAANSEDDCKVGLDDDLIQIMDRATGRGSTIQIIPIIGMGGIGKTTLARSVYENPLIVDHFDVRSWVTISQGYNIQDILIEMISSSKLEHRTDEDVGLLMLRVYKLLKGRRYLIVLDDMWHGEAWMELRIVFPNDMNGSRVILTTRLSELAAYVDPSSPVHRVQLLNEDKCWALLHNQVFAEESCPDPQLKEIGKMIARSCKGLPLVIVVIAGLLKVNKAPDYWEKVAKDVIAAAATTSDDDQLYGILSLSYNNLPHHLKACFLHMGIYPEDFEISINQLIKLWVADGFLKPVSPNKSFEEAAEEYLEDIVGRNLVMVAKKKSSGKVRTCRIHDVLRELSLRKAQEEKFLMQHFTDRYIKVSLPQTIKNQRRLTIHTNNFDSLEDEHIPGSSVRSLTYFGSFSDKLSSFTSRFGLLRVVDKLLVNSEVFPLEIFELVNLRYLAFIYDYNGTSSIPASISKLKNLQTLIVIRGSSVKYDTCQLFLPSEIWDLPQLRHLVLMRSTILLSYGETDHSILNNLQTLSKVQNFEFTKEAVERLRNVKKLRIHYANLDHNNWSKFHLDNLVHLQHLEELTFRFHAGNGSINHYPLLKDISFPINLKKITLTGSWIPWDKMSAIGSLPNLEVLKLRRDSFAGRTWEPTDGEFLQLKYLEMVDLNLKFWKAESNHFPRLKQLRIWGCRRLKEVPQDIGEIPTLQTLTIAYCNPQVEESVRQIQMEQRDMGNDELQVHNYTPYTGPAATEQEEQVLRY